MDLGMDVIQAAQNALQCVFEVKPRESLVIFCDDTRLEIGTAFQRAAESLGLDSNLLVLRTSPSVFRNELPPEVEEYLTAKRPLIYINLMRGIREETPFRIKLIHLETSDHKTRLGHCPGLTKDMLTEGALALTVAEHHEMQNLAECLMKMLQPAARIELKTPFGTRVSFSVKERVFFTDTKIDWNTMKWMNLPTGEVIVAPIEDSLEGEIVCDVAIGGIGMLKKPLKLIVKKGKVCEVSSPESNVLRRVRNSLQTDEMASVVGEFAFGVNAKARFIEEFLESEKVFGTVHIAFGDNTDFPGGQNDSGNHMDFLMSKPTVEMVTDAGNSVVVLKNGKFCFKRADN
jgi:aminopeptidase